MRWLLGKVVYIFILEVGGQDSFFLICPPPPIQIFGYMGTQKSSVIKVLYFSEKNWFEVLKIGV